jgi:hypothetical protein
MKWPHDSRDKLVVCWFGEVPHVNRHDGERPADPPERMILRRWAYRSLAWSGPAFSGCSAMPKARALDRRPTAAASDGRVMPRDLWDTAFDDYWINFEPGIAS